MPSPGEMPSQPGKQSAADAADNDTVLIDEEPAVREPGRGPRVPGGASPVRGGDAWTAPPPVASDEGARPQVAPGAASTAAGSSRTVPSAPRNDQRWREIQAMFVDDPRDSVQRASDLIDTAIEEFLASIRQRQAILASSWQNRDADTEALRLVLKDYRGLWAVVRDMPTAGVDGGAAAASAGIAGSSLAAGPGGAVGPREPARGNTPL